jgi:hypothetical protein
MYVPWVVLESSANLSLFKMFWCGDVVETVMFQGHFYRMVRKFSRGERLEGYEYANHLAQHYRVLITIAGVNEDSKYMYSIWADTWDVLPDQDLKRQLAVALTTSS